MMMASKYNFISVSAQLLNGIKFFLGENENKTFCNSILLKLQAASLYFDCITFDNLQIHLILFGWEKKRSILVTTKTKMKFKF